MMCLKHEDPRITSVGHPEHQYCTCTDPDVSIYKLADDCGMEIDIQHGMWTVLRKALTQNVVVKVADDYQEAHAWLSGYRACIDRYAAEAVKEARQAH